MALQTGQKTQAQEADAKSKESTFFVIAGERDFAVRVGPDSAPGKKDGKLTFKRGEIVEVRERYMVHLAGYFTTWLRYYRERPSVEVAEAVVAAADRNKEEKKQ